MKAMIRLLFNRGFFYAFNFIISHHKANVDNYYNIKKQPLQLLVMAVFFISQCNLI
jgi:hypothetical protein